MHIDIISVVPELLESPFSHSILMRAIDKGLVTLDIHDLRAFGLGNYRQVDDYQFGGGAGMVLMAEPLDQLLTSLTKEKSADAIVYLTPDGKTWNQSMANAFSLKERLILICGHYKGIDQRIRDLWVTHEVSIGDYVLSGGELAASVVSDSIIRLIPGVLNDAGSALSDSFQDKLLAPPVYTRPAEFKGLKVPEVLLSGNFKAIETWREAEALRRTQERRPDILSD
ncbi:MAG: tRNA (guanosine(37)-N1)-methyltransferase TrmD [Flavobacteriaceae bacterium]